MVTLDQAGWLGSRVTVASPPPPIAAHVEHVFRLDFRDGGHADWRVLPDTSAHVLVHLTRRGAEGSLVRAAVVGARTSATDTDASERVWTVGVRLRPGALPALVGLQAQELTDRSATFQELWGRSGIDFVDRMGGT